MSPDVFSVRAAGTADVDAMGRVFEEAFDEPYGAAAVADLLKPPSVWSAIAELGRNRGSTPIGYVIVSSAADEAEILSIGVSPAMRRMSVGRALINYTVHHARSSGAAKIFLEVAADNVGAIALYGATGFERVGLRRNYYRRRGDITVDALILRHDLP